MQIQLIYQMQQPLPCLIKYFSHQTLISSKEESYQDYSEDVQDALVDLLGRIASLLDSWLVFGQLIVVSPRRSRRVICLCG